MEIPGSTVQNAFMIPRRALYNEKYIYLIKEGKLEFREIKIARIQTDSVILNGGVQNGDTLVTDVLQGVASGMPALARGAVKGEI